jgi:hypothetical protein
MSKKDHFLQQLQRRRQTHLKQAPSHVDGPSEKTMEQLEVDLKRAELGQQIDSLEQRQAEQHAMVGGLRRELEQARETDLNQEAAALQTEAAKPKPKAPEIERALEAAEHDLEVIGRAWTMAQTDLGQYKAKNCEKLLRKLQRTKTKRAQGVASRAKPLLDELRGFYTVDEDIKELKLYLHQERETGEPGSGEAQRYTLALGGVQTTQSVFGNRVAGLERSQLEGVIASLARLETVYPEASEASQEAEGTDAA